MPNRIPRRNSKVVSIAKETRIDHGRTSRDIEHKIYLPFNREVVRKRVGMETGYPFLLKTTIKERIVCLHRDRVNLPVGLL